MKKTLKSIFALPLLLALTACPGTRTGNPDVVSTGLIVTGSAQPASSTWVRVWDFVGGFLERDIYALTPPSMVDSTGLSVTLSEAWIVVKDIEFKADESASGSEASDVKYLGPYAVDLLSQSPTSLGNQSLSGTGYRRIKMKLEKAESSLAASMPAGLSGNSIYLSGVVGGNTFTYSTTDGSEYEVAGPNAVTPTASENLIMVIRFADLIKKVNLSAVASGTHISESNRQLLSNPCPLIDKSAEDLFTCFRKGLESQADFGKDRGSHDLSDTDEKVK